MDRPVTVIGAPTDYGTDRRGVDMGPSAIRYAGLTEALTAIDIDVTDAGDLAVPRPEERDPGDESARFLREVEAVSRELADAAADTVDAGNVPLVLGGDHSVAIGSIGGVARECDVGVLWFDAHGDFNTPETTPSGNVHGMPLAAVLGRDSFADSEWAVAPGLREQNVALVGARDLDPGERRALRESDVSVFTMSDIDECGIGDVVDEALAVACDGVEALHCSLDADWLDPKEAPGVGTPKRGGATYREAHYAMERVAAAETPLSSLEVVEVNPILDQHNETAELAVELIASVLGKHIL